MLWIQRIKLKHQYPNIYPHQAILKGKKLFNTVRNPTEIKSRVTHLQELKEGALATGKAGWEGGTTVPLALPLCTVSANPHPHLFSQQHCEPSAKWTDFGFTSLSLPPAHTLMKGLRTSKTANRQAMWRSSERAGGIIIHRGCSDILTTLPRKPCYPQFILGFYHSRAEGASCGSCIPLSTAAHSVLDFMVSHTKR